MFEVLAPIREILKLVDKFARAVQPVDFFGTGPRIPMIAVSPFSRGGHITHVYGEHSSFVKFVEHNWHLGKLSDRSATTCRTRAFMTTTTCPPTCRRSAICSTCSTSMPAITIMIATIVSEWRREDLIFRFRNRRRQR